MKRKILVSVIIVFLPIFLFGLEIGIVYDGPLRVRENNSIESKQIATLQTFETVRIIKKSSKSDSINGINEYWYQIQNKENTIGWVFGGYLSIFTISDSEKNSVFNNKITSCILDFLSQYKFSDDKIRVFVKNKIIDESYFQGNKVFSSIKTLDNDYSELVVNNEQNIFLILYKKKDTTDSVISDIRIIKKENNTSYLTTGPVKINDQTWDWNINVLVNGPFEKGVNKNISSAYKSNTNSGEIQKLSYSSIALYSEE